MKVDDLGTPIGSLENWLAKKPYWERYVWKMNLEKESLAEEDIDLCYKLLSEELVLIPRPQEVREEITLRNEIRVVPETTRNQKKVRLLEVKDFENVNALPKDCSVKFGPNLTLIYGGNGTGKSGIGRVLCNACFYRGNREVLPNVKVITPPSSKAKAVFVIDDGYSKPAEINYSLGENYDDLKSFSVFDSESVLIHFDKSNKVKFTPAQIRIFDKVTETITKLESRLIKEKSEKRKDNPFELMFINEESDVAQFCKGITAATDESELLRYSTFNTESGEEKILKLKNRIDEKKKLDVPKKKSQLKSECKNLQALQESLQSVIVGISVIKATQHNKLISDILEKENIVKGLSIESFDKGIFKKIGSPEWKSLITAAKVLYEAELNAIKGKELDYCLLCHQELKEPAKSLYKNYWNFLGSKAENELADLMKKQSILLSDLETTRTKYPMFLETDAGIKVLTDANPEYLTQIKEQFSTLSGILDDWIAKIKKLSKIQNTSIPIVDVSKIDDLIVTKTNEETNLVDSSDEITTLTGELKSLEHKKQLSAIKEKADDYLAYLKWLKKTGAVNFPGIKATLTKKRTELISADFADSYKGLFNQELNKLGCELDLVMHTSGELGNTVKEFRLDFAEEYNPSQILSEGEQNVCSLADFLTETQLDKNNCGIIFDDPVTSLDHERKEKIAKRLVEEAKQKQVICFTHDIVFMSYLVQHAEELGVSIVTHWIKSVGLVEENSGPILATLSKLKEKSMAALRDYDKKTSEEKEIAVGAAFNFLRDACEALVEEKLFAKTIRRWEDRISIDRLEEAVFDESSAIRLVEFYNKIPKVGTMHNRSDVKRENPLSIETFNQFKKQYDEIEAQIFDLSKKAIADRHSRKKNSVSEKIGWEKG